MSYDVLKSHKSLKELDSDLDKYLNTAEMKMKYKKFRDIISDLRTFVYLCSVANEEGELLRLDKPKFELLKCFMVSAIEESDKILNGPADDKVLLQIRSSVRDLKTTLEDDYL